MAERNRHDSAFERKARERLVEGTAAANAHGAEDDKLVLAPGGEHSLQRSENVVADAGSRMRKRRDVVRDPHECV